MNLLKLILDISEHKQARNQFQGSKAENGDIIPARCRFKSETFGIVLNEDNNGQLFAEKGIRFNEAENQNYLHNRKLAFPNGIRRGSAFKCPVCNNPSFVRCNECGEFSCYNGSGWFKCPVCRNRGIVKGSIHSARAFRCDEGDKAYAYSNAFCKRSSQAAAETRAQYISNIASE